MFYQPYFLFEVLALATCTFTYKYFDKIYKRFLPFLIFIVLYELADILDLFIYRNTNATIGNFEYLTEFIFYSLFIKALIKQSRLYNKVNVVVIIVVVFTLVDIFFIQGFWRQSTIAILVQYGVLVFLVCVFFYNLLQNADPETSILQLPSFWITTGLLFFCLIEFFYQTAFNFMVYKGNKLFITIYFVLNNLAIFVLYTFLSIGFLCFRRKVKLSK